MTNFELVADQMPTQFSNRELAEQQVPEQLRTSERKRAAEMYADLVSNNGEIPATPEALPPECLVPQSYLGEIFAAADDNITDGHEYQQVINVKDGQPEPSDRVKNLQPHAAVYQLKMAGRRVVQGLPLSHYHSHPKDTPDLSGEDLEIMISNPVAHMEFASTKLEGGAYMIQGVFRTQKSRKRPLSPIKPLQVRRNVDKIWKRSLMKGEQHYPDGTSSPYELLDNWQYNTELLQYLEENGLGWYYFKSDSETPLDEQLVDGNLPFKKITAEMFENDLTNEQKMDKLHYGEDQLGIIMPSTTSPY